MSDVTVRHIKEPEKWVWYNSEGRPSMGCYYSNKDDMFYGGGETQVQTFYLDGSNTDVDHKKTTTFFTLKNGVHCDIEYYIVNEGSVYSDGGFRILGVVHYRDKDGNDIHPTTGVNLFEAYQDTGTDISHVKVRYISSEATYLNNGTIPDTGSTGASFNMFGGIFGQRYWENPNQRPLGSDMTYSEFVTNWNGVGLGHCYNWEEVDNFFQTIVDGGDGSPITPILPSEDTSEPGGGDNNDPKPDYNPFSDPVSFPGLPTGGDAISTGFIRVYQPTSAQLQSLAGELWSDSFINTIKKIQNDPMEAIISLHSLPFSVAGGNATCKIGNYTSGVTMPVVAGQYAKRNLGSIYIPEHWASALDYAPYVDIQIFLPFLGVRALQVDDVIGKTLTVEYNVDVISGATVICIMCGNSVLYTYNTSLISSHPISQSSFAPLFQSIVGATGNILSGYGMAGAPGAVGAVIGSGINVALSKQHSISRGGSIGGNSGCLGNFTPYLIIHRPIQSLASGFGHFKGYPSNITGTIGSVTGYTEVESVHLNGIKCTDNERAEIEALLYNGVIV